MNEGPEKFMFKKDEMIVPKRVNVLLPAIEAFFGEYNIDAPSEVEIGEVSAAALASSTEEEIASVLSTHLEALRRIPSNPLFEGRSIEDQIQEYVIGNPMFIAYLEKARSIQTGKDLAV